MLSDGQIEKFRETGFILFEGNFDQNQLGELRQIFENSKEKVKNYSGWAFMGMFRFSPLYLKFITDSGALEIARQLTGNQQVDLYWDSVVVKTAGNQRQFC